MQFHRSELVDHELVAGPTDAPLLEQYRPRRRELHNDGNEHHHRAGQQQKNAAEQQVFGALDEAVDALHGGDGQVHHGHAGNFSHGMVEQFVAEEVGDVTDVGGAVAQGMKGGAQVVFIAQGHGNPHFIHSVRIDERLQVVQDA